MAKREVITLNESTPQLEAPQTGDTYLLPRDTASTTGVFTSEVADGASAEAFSFDSENALSTSGAKIVSYQNNGTEKACIDKDGVGSFGGVGSGAEIRIGKFNAEIEGLYAGNVRNSIRLSNTNSITMKTKDLYINDVLNPSIVGGQSESTFETFTVRAAKAREVGVYKDMPGNDIHLLASDAMDQDSGTGEVGGDALLSGGDGSSNGTGDAHGGNVTITGGTGYGTGHDGYVMMTNLPTSDPGVTGALWNNSGVLTVS